MIIQLRDIIFLQFQVSFSGTIETVVNLGYIPPKNTIVWISSFTPLYFGFISEFQEAEFRVSACYICLPACEVCECVIWRVVFLMLLQLSFPSFVLQAIKSSRWPKSQIEGDVRVCGDAVFRCNWCGFAVIFIWTRGMRFQNTKRFAVITTYKSRFSVKKSVCGDGTR